MKKQVLSKYLVIPEKSTMSRGMDFCCLEIYSLDSLYGTAKVHFLQGIQHPMYLGSGHEPKLTNPNFRNSTIHLF